MANYHKRNSIRAVQWDPENAQSFEDIHDLPEVVAKVFAGHPEFTHTFFHEGN